MYFVTLHEWMKKQWPWLLCIIGVFVAGFFVCNAYLRWEGIETGIFSSQRHEPEHFSGSGVSLCDGVKTRGPIFDSWSCGFDECQHVYYDDHGNVIGQTAMILPDLPEDYVRNCRETTSEYLHRFVSREQLQKPHPAVWP